MLGLLLIGMSIGIGVIFWHSLSTSYFISFPVTYNKHNHPRIDVKVGNNTHVLEVRIGSRFPLFLSKEALSQTDKQSHGISQWQSMNGEPREAPSYLIPKMHVGDLTLTNVIATEQEAAGGVLGKYLGGEFNLFLDFPHSRIIACDSFSKLKNKGLISDDWIQVPFELPDKAGVVFQVNTDLGTHRLSLGTTATMTVLRSTLIQSKESFVSSIFSIGTREFGNTLIQPFELFDDLQDTDGFIGMDFLKKHAIYLDYSNKIAYIEPPDRYCERIPVVLSSCSIPTVNAHIEGNLYSFEIDLGSSCFLFLGRDVLQNIQTTSYGTAEWSDFKGNSYESPTYTISEFNINKLTFSDVLVVQDREDFRVNIMLEGMPAYPTGSIGRPILEKYNLFLDFQRSAIYACDSHLHLQQRGLLSEDFLTIPFTLHRDGILLSVETDSGIKRLILDTGSSRTVIRAPQVPSTSLFCLGGHNFGAQAIAAIDLTPDRDYDGYLGMDFLLEHSLFIDYPHKLIFLDLQKGG